MEAALGAIQAQEYALDLREKGRLRYVADDPDCPDILRLAALAEELGEVARAIHDDSDSLRAELLQTAGVALAWALILEP